MAQPVEIAHGAQRGALPEQHFLVHGHDGDLEAQVGTAVSLGEAHIVEHGADIKQFRIIFQRFPLTRQGTPEENPARMVVQ